VAINPQQVSLADSSDGRWRNRWQLLAGRKSSQSSLENAREMEYRLIKELWAFH
jgi:uncharacterized protein